jgi:hypothetical protein
VSPRLTLEPRPAQFASEQPLFVVDAAGLRVPLAATLGAAGTVNGPRCGKCPASRKPRKNGLVVRCGFDAGGSLSLSSHDAGRVERVSENVTRTDIVFVVHPSSSNMR